MNLQQLRRLATSQGRKEIRWENKQQRIPDHMVWNEQDFYGVAKERYSRSVPGIPEIRCFFLQSALRSLHDLAGDVVECGTRSGKSALYMHSACEQLREFFLFDSFEGLSDPVPGKDSLTSSRDSDRGVRLFDVDFDQVRQRFAACDNVHLMKGWIPDRFPEVAERNICLLHVDVDLYQPTRDSLEFFYQRVVSGGMIICDDYGSGAYPGARLAMDNFFADKPETPIELPQGQAFIVKR